MNKKKINEKTKEKINKIIDMEVDYIKFLVNNQPDTLRRYARDYLDIDEERCNEKQIDEILIEQQADIWFWADESIRKKYLGV